MTLVEIIVNIVIIFNIIFVLILLNIILIKTLFEKPRDIRYYYINNFFFTIMSNYLYIIFFVFLLYCLRLYKCSNLLDLKNVYNIFIDLINLLLLFPIYTQISISFILILLLSFLCLNTVLFHKYFRHQIYKLYLNARYHPECKYNNTIFDMNIITEPYDSDLISHFVYLLSSEITNKCFKPSNMQWSYYYTALPWFHFHKLICNIIFNKYYKNFLIPFSPLFVILYDCYYNDFILTHIYYYMLLYIPLMVWRRLTILISQESFNIGQLVWNILYKKEDCIYALSTDHNKLFQLYLMNGLKRIDINPNSGDMDSSMTLYLLKASKFTFNTVENFYENIEGIEIHNVKPDSINNSLVVIKWTDLKEVKENWILIIKKTITDE